jgi:hypothetical protein
VKLELPLEEPDELEEPELPLPDILSVRVCSCLGFCCVELGCLGSEVEGSSKLFEGRSSAVRGAL